jgi:hypothetical protein
MRQALQAQWFIEFPHRVHLRKKQARMLQATSFTLAFGCMAAAERSSRFLQKITDVLGA